MMCFVSPKVLIATNWGDLMRVNIPIMHYLYTATTPCNPVLDDCAGL